MKKFLLSMAAAALCMSASAATVTFDFTKDAYGLPNDGETYVETPATITSGAVSIKLNGGWRMWNDGLREYYKTAGTSFTVSAGSEMITNIEISAKSGVKFSLTEGGDAVSSWTGSASSVTFYNVSTSNAAVTSISVTYGEGGSTPDPDQPGQPENPGGDTPSNPGGDQPTDGNVSQAFDNGLGFPEGKTNVPKTATDYTATDTNIVYTIMGCYTNSGYLMVNGKDNEGAFISWSLDFPMAQLQMTTTSGCSTNVANTVNIYADGNLVAENYQVNSQSATYTIDIPEAYQKAGTVYKVESATTKYNAQFASFTFIKQGNEVENPGGGETPEPTPAELITVKEALEAIASNNIPTGNVQVKGIISSITDYSTSYGNATFLMVDAQGDTNALTVFRTKWLGNTSFTEEGLIAVGGTITVEGKLQDYNGTPELTNGVVVEYTAPQGGGNEPGPDQPGEPDQPSEPGKGLTENFNTGIGFPDGSANVPTSSEVYTSNETGIKYTLYGCYANSGYLMVNSKTYKEAFISWSLDFPMVQLVMTTTSGCSTNANNYAEVYAGDNLIESVFVGVQNETLTVAIPTQYQAAGTIYTVKAAESATANEQFASFTYVEDVTEGVGAIEAVDGEAVYYNLQGVKVAHPDKGIYVKVQNGKATKVIL